MNNEMYGTNNVNNNNVNNVNPQHCHYRFSWTAVLVGAFVATGLSFLLGLFDMGIGLTVVNNTNDGVQTVVVGGLIGMLIGSVVTMYVAGWVAGLLSRHCCTKGYLGSLHGFVAWCLALVISMLLLSPQINVLTVGPNMVANNMSPHPITHMVANKHVATTSNNAMMNTPNAPVASVEKATNQLGIGTLIAFLLFFLGAFAAVVGGYCGAVDKKCCEKDANRRI